MPPRSQSLDLKGLLRQTRRLKAQMLSFRRSAEVVVEPLGEIIPDDESEAMLTARANIHGTLEELLNQGLGDLLRQLVELDENLGSEIRPKSKAVRSTPAVAAKGVRLRRSEP